MTAKPVEIEQWKHCDLCRLGEGEWNACDYLGCKDKLKHTCFVVRMRRKLLMFDHGIIAFRNAGFAKYFVAWFPNRTMARKAKFATFISYLDAKTGEKINL